jgi:hypothetical protein
MTTKKTILSLNINLVLFLVGLAMVFSGILLQLVYHMGHHGGIDTNHSVLGLNYFNWSDIHKYSILILSLALVFHVTLHWKWYKTVLKKKRLVLRNQQAIILTIVFLSVAISGYIPWFIKLGGGSELDRKALIEVHDKITWVLLIYLIFHVCKRFKWYFLTLKKLKNPENKSIENKTTVDRLAH